MSEEVNHFRRPCWPLYGSTTQLQRRKIFRTRFTVERWV